MSRILNCIAYLLLSASFMGCQVNMLFPHPVPISPLALAASRGEVSKVESMLKAGQDPNYLPHPDHWSPLFQAVRFGQLNVVKLLLKYKANPNFGGALWKDAYPLSMASSVVMAKTLLDAGADINKQDKLVRKTALFYAIKNNSLDTATFLLDRGAKVNVKDYAEETPLSYAVSSKNVPMTKLLLKYGADPTIPDAQLKPAYICKTDGIGFFESEADKKIRTEFEQLFCRGKRYS